MPEGYTAEHVVYYFYLFPDAQRDQDVVRQRDDRAQGEPELETERNVDQHADQRQKDGPEGIPLQILADLGPRYGSDLGEAIGWATGYARELADTERPEVVCHGDPHAGNVLRRGSGWALIDPDGFVGERAYDLGVVLRDACDEFAAAEAAGAGAAGGAGEALLRERCCILVHAH